ncbi:MAG: dipeptide epimerase [Ferruginibacter sp.]|nr:dipeptide epimerase [Cytophagales bacterium]
MQLILHRYALPLKHTFTIAHDSRDSQETLIVELRDGEYRGYGEATANPYYGVTIEETAAALEAIREKIEGYDLGEPEPFWEAMRPYLKETPFAQCALDTAANDLYGKKAGQRLHQLWGLADDRLPITNYTIGIDTIDRMVAKMKEVPWPLYKIKLGTSEDIAIVTALRQYSNATFRVDANCAWTVAETIANAGVLKTLGVEFIEQPLPAENDEGMETVIRHSALPLIADESCIAEADVARCQGRFHGINIKLTKCGGLTPARRMIAEARRLGLKVMVGCMTESSVGISAIAQLLPLLDYVDMDGALLLKKDIATGVTIEFGRVRFPDENGTGVTLLEKPLASRVDD